MLLRWVSKAVSCASSTAYAHVSAHIRTGTIIMLDW